MTETNITTPKLSNQDRLDEASILLYRAIALNDLLYEASTRKIDLLESTFSGTTDAIHTILKEAKSLIDGVEPNKELHHA